MDYGALIRGAWVTTWRHRFLWVLGLFAGGAVGIAGAGRNGPGMRWQTSPREMERVLPAAATEAQQAEYWVATHVGLIIGAITVLLALGLALLVISIIAQGGMAEATVDLASGRPASLGQAWRAGLHLFWRYVGLYLLLITAAIVVAATLGAAGAAVLASFASGAPPNPVLAAVAGVVGVGLLIAGAVVAIGLSIVVAYAQRAIYAEDAGPLQALRAGWQVLRTHPGTSALTWLVNLALAIGIGIAATLAAVAVAAVLVALGFGIWAISEAAGVAYLVLAALGVLAGGALVVAVINTFFWHYWTLAYLQLSGRGAAPATT